LGKAFFLVLLSWSVIFSAGVVAAPENSWGEAKDKHFVIYYENKNDATFGRMILRKAEEYYQKIGSDTGFLRANRFWTNNQRVKIFLFSTRESFLSSTGQPSWSIGYADRDSQTFRSKTIITYRQETDFVDGLLPHEISHLILHDFIQADRIPIWFDEGVAQMQEKNKLILVRGIMAKLVAQRMHIPIDQFRSLDVRRVRDTRTAEIFYAQSLSIIDFLITKYGREAFGRLCRELRDGKDFEGALSKAYPRSIENYRELETKWLQFLKN